MLSGLDENVYQGDTLHNNGRVFQEHEWAYGQVSLGNSQGDRLRFQGVIGKAKGFIGIDSVHLSTREKCSPRFGTMFFIVFIFLSFSMLM